MHLVCLTPWRLVYICFSCQVKGYTDAPTTLAMLLHRTLSFSCQVKGYTDAPTTEAERAPGL